MVIACFTYDLSNLPEFLSGVVRATETTLARLVHGFASTRQ